MRRWVLNWIRSKEDIDSLEAASPEEFDREHVGQFGWNSFPIRLVNAVRGISSPNRKKSGMNLARRTIMVCRDTSGFLVERRAPLGTPRRSIFRRGEKV